MKTIEIVVATSSEAAEIVADIMSEFSYSGVSIKDKNDLRQLQVKKTGTWDYIDDELIRASESQTDAVLVSGFVEKSKAKVIVGEIHERLEELRQTATVELGSLEILQNSVDENAWHKEWKKHFKPFKIVDVVICPKWIRYKAAADETMVLLNSGVAFGTGEHETTAMCIELLQRFDLTGKSVFDVGCGSGILGIVAAKLGAKSCVLSDIDSMAVSAAGQNVRLNKVTRVARVENKNLLGGAVGTADFVFANLTASLLIELLGGLKTVTHSGSTLIVSGIITEKIDEVIEAYTQNGFSVIEKLEKNEWCAIAFKVK